MQTRPTLSSDVPALQHVLDETELFPSDMLLDMLGGSDGADIWLTALQGKTPVGFCYAVPEQMAEGAWNMLAIAVLPDVQNKGVGSAIVAALESALRDQSARIVIADTSGTDAFKATRGFYASNGYTQEARVRDFWAAGDDKVVFWKALG